MESQSSLTDSPLSFASYHESILRLHALCEYCRSIRLIELKRCSYTATTLSSDPQVLFPCYPCWTNSLELIWSSVPKIYCFSGLVSQDSWTVRHNSMESWSWICSILSWITFPSQIPVRVLGRGGGGFVLQLVESDNWPGNWNCKCKKEPLFLRIQNVKILLN